MAAQHLYCLERGCAAEDIYLIFPEAGLRCVIALNNVAGRQAVGFKTFDEATAAIDDMPIEVLENGSPIIINMERIGTVYTENPSWN